jgi:hypothetical protein
VNRPLLAAAALLLAACSTGPTTAGLRLNEPSAIVAYSGVAPANAGQAQPGVRPLLAVASRRGDELRLIDPSSDQPIFGPGIIFPLSIPTVPRPQLLASASFGDGGADLLVAVSAGSTVLQVIETWTETSRVARDVDLGGVGGVLPAGTEILSLLGIPGVSGDRKARLLVGTTGARLVVLEFSRGPAGEVVDGTPVVPTPVAQLLNFDPIDMALLPAPPEAPTARTVFFASRDAVGTTGGKDTFGLAQLVQDGLAVPSVPWETTPLAAGASTVAVAAAWVDERVVNSSDNCSPYAFNGVKKPRVYAALDESRCGPDQPIACGIVTFDVTTGQLATDLAAAPLAAPGPATPDGITVPTQGYRAPMPVFGVPVHIAIGYAPASGFSRHTNDLVIPSGCRPDLTSSVTPMLRLQPAPGSIDTSAVAMVTSSDGRVYWYDLSRSALVNEVDAVLGGSRAGLTSASTVPLTAGTAALGLWRNDATGTLGTDSITVDPVALPFAIETWPGFTESATWSLTWQGGLPSLQRRAGVIATIGVNTFATFQIVTPAGTHWTDAAFGVHVGDILEFPSLGCETTIAAFVPPGTGVAPFNAGAVQLAGVPVDASGNACPAGATGATPVPATMTVRASGLVLVNDRSGYMGRPELAPATTDPALTYTLAWKEESNIPADQPEVLALARKARRIFYPIDPPCPIPGALAGTQGANTAGCYVGFPDGLADPLSPGPALRLRPGSTLLSAAGVADGKASVAPLARDTTLTFVTSSGLIPTSRVPASGGALPAGIAVVDPTSFPGHEQEAVRFYVPYADDQVLEFTAAGSTGQVTSLR